MRVGDACAPRNICELVLGSLSDQVEGLSPSLCPLFVFVVNGHPPRPWAEDGRERVVYKVDVVE